MNSSRIRLFLAFAIIAYSIVVTINFGIQRSWITFVAGVLLIWLHFAYGTVWLAYKALRSGDVPKAENWLSEIKNPKWLRPSPKAYYYLTLGLINLQHKDFQSGEKHLQLALDLGFRNSNDQALTLLNLGHIHFVQRNFELANRYVNQGSQLEMDEVLAEKYKEIGEALLSKLN